MKTAHAKSFAAILFALVCVAACAAQQPCELASQPAPLLLNLRVGMSPEQAQTIFRKDLKIKVKKDGERTFFQNFIKKPAPVSLRGVRALYLRFFDRRLYQIEIFYEPRTDLPTLQTIAGALSAQLNFSISDWQIENNRARITCGETSLVADYILNPRVELTNETVRAVVEAEREKDAK